MRRLSILIVCILVAFFCCGQQNYNWYFGSTAGIKFIPTGTSPVPSIITNSAMVATEGCSSICDDMGRMLFYTNGRTIYNKLNRIMANGSGLAGHESALQSCIIVPLPNNTSLFYVFTADAIENDYINGYRYSIVDMTGDGGNGIVTAKNILLYAPSSERLTAARHANGIDVWIITNDSSSNTFRSWLLTCTGLQAAPVVSVTGIVLNQYLEMNTGVMKVSPDGKQLCQTHFPDQNSSNTQNFFQLFDFDNATGIISNPKSINVAQYRYFACEFSPDSRLLYLTKSGPELDQFQCKLPTASQVIASVVVIPAVPALCGLQLAPDGKIYLSDRTSRLSVISSPNSPGISCNYESTKVDLLGNFGGLNMPSFVNDMSVDVNHYFDVRILDTCDGLIQFTGHTSFSGPVIWSWDFGDGATSSLQNPQHIFSDIRNLYTVRLTITPAVLCGFITKTKFIFPAGLVLKAGFNIINNCDSVYVRFENTSTRFPEIPLQYNWNFGDGNTSTESNPIHTYANPGTYSVKLKIKTSAPCLDDSVTKSLDITRLNIQASADQVVDEGNSVQLNVTGAGTNLRWEPAKWLNSGVISNPVATPLDDIMYIVTATNDAGCKDTDTVYIKVNPKTNIYVPSAFTPNNDGKNDRFKPVLSLQYTINSFMVYNRWGDVVYSSTTGDEGWNGTIKGLQQDTGIFVWVLKITDRKNQVINRKGIVMLIR
jgi:gliding motility-associated-like protein